MAIFSNLDILVVITAAGAAAVANHQKVDSMHFIAQSIIMFVLSLIYVGRWRVMLNIR